jgi:homopolymeric O-antigen transport system ATP-binding protein
MSDIAIRVENLSKLYHIGKRQASYKTLRDTLANAFVSPFRRVGKLLRGKATGAAELDETIWALKNVSLEIKTGEVVGIIGRNGAGKSTLLKILSRITEPTEGSAEIYGRVGSLLEVGTGFHPELTGRENIYMNGAILGMKRSEIITKFDEIVAFAEIEKFIDTPVKHYSSGMYLRLAFSVAAHLETEIVFVDEVLAVGDARFQKKCVNKMRDLGSKGRTLIFVSHSMPTITRLCERAVLLEEGRIIEDGPSLNVVHSYLSSDSGTSLERIWPEISKSPGNEIVRLRAVRVKHEDARHTDSIDICSPVGIEMQYDVLTPDYVLIPYYHFFRENGVLAFEVLDTNPEWRRRPRPKGRYKSTVWIPGNFLSEGMYSVYSAIITADPNITHVNERDTVTFQVIDSFKSDSARGDYRGTMSSAVRPLLKWDTQFCTNSMGYAFK